MDAATSDESPSRWSRIVGRVVKTVLVVIVLLYLFLLFMPLHGRRHGDAARRANCVNNLKQFGIALVNYHDHHKTFPPAYVADADGKPMHSWRILLLPHFEEGELREFSEKYNFDEPWNGPNNRKLAAKAPAVFRCPSDPEHEGETNYVAIVGDQTVWPGANAIAIKGISDGENKTICVVETFESRINWLEPRDISFVQAQRGINPPGIRPSISSNHRDGAYVLMCDGSVHFLPDDSAPETLRRLLTANGGEKVEIPEWQGGWHW